MGLIRRAGKLFEKNSLRRSPARRRSVAGRSAAIDTRAAHIESLERRRLLEGDAQLLFDVNPSAASAGPGSIVEVGALTFFTADDGVNGSELWKTDGTSSGTMLVRDIRAGSNSSLPSNLTNVGGRLYFRANDGVSGSELWKSDGTSAGTVLVKDISSGSSASSPNSFTNVGGTLYFTASNIVNGYELWKSDGTSAGTILVKDIRAGSYSSLPSNLTNVGGTLYFQANDGVNGNELWKSNGTSSGTALVIDLRAGAIGSFPRSLTNVGGTLFFQANDDNNDNELWKCNGTNSGTILVKDIRAGAIGSDPRDFVNVSGVLFFSANNGANGFGLWKSDGTSSGTTLVKIIQPGTNSSYPASLVNMGGTLYFGATDGVNGYELWKSNGTSAGTVLVKDIRVGATGSDPRYLTNMYGTLYFRADDGVNGRELWRSDGTSSGTMLASDIRSAALGSNPGNLTNVGGILYFTANDGVYGIELWTTNGFAPSTPALATGSDTGVSSTDRITRITTPTFTGTSIGTSVTIYANGVAVGTGPVVNGNYNITTSALADATWSITATTVYNTKTSVASSAASVTIDTTAPTTVGLQLSITFDGIYGYRARSEATFSEGVYGVTTAPFRLTLNGGADMVAGAGSAVDQVNASFWRVYASQSLLPLPGGLYRGALLASSSGITDAAGNALSTGATTSLQYNGEPQARPYSQFLVTGAAGNFWELSPDLALDAQSNLVAVWLRTVNPALPPPALGPPAQTGLILQRFDPSGSAAGDERLIAADAVGGFATIDSADDGRSVVAWLELDESIPPPFSQLGLFAQLLDAQSNPVGAPFRVESATAGPPVFHTLTVQPNGEFALSWSTAGHEIYYRHFSATGAPQGGEVLVVSNANVASQHDFAIDAQGNAVVTWVETVQGNDNIYFRRFDTSGTPLGAGPTLVTAVTGSGTSAMVALAADGQVTILASTGYSQSQGAVPTGPATVRFWQYSAVGELLSGPVQVNQANTYGSADVQYTSLGDLLITWNEGNSSSTQSGKILLRRYTHAGTPLELAPRLINIISSYQPAPTQLDVNAVGDYVVAWNRDIPLVGPTNRVEAMAYVNHALAWDMVPVTSAFTAGTSVAPVVDMEPDVAIDAQGNFGVVWVSSRLNGQMTPQVQYRRFDASGTPTGDAQVLNGAESAAISYTPARISSAPDGQTVAVWIAGPSTPSPNQPWSLWARLIDANGTPQGTPFRVDSGVGYYPTQGTVAVADNGTFVIAWITSTKQVRARRFAGDGSPLSDEFFVGGSNQSYLNPRNSLDVDTNAVGDFIISWFGYVSDGSQPVMYQRFSSNGTAIDPAPVNTGITTEYYAGSLLVSTSLNDSGEFAIGWAKTVEILSTINPLVPSSPQAPRFRLYSRNGVPKSGIIYADAQPRITQIDVFLDQAGDLTFTYSVQDDPRISNSPYHVVIRKIQGDTRLAMSDPITVSDSGPGRAASALAISPSGALAVVWNNVGYYAAGYGSDYAVRARLYKPALNVSIASPTDGYRGEALQFTFSASGTNVTPTTAVKYSIDWDGNGTIDQTVQGQASGATATHAYFTSAVHMPKVTASTAAATSRREVRSVTITDYVLRPNVDNAALTDLIWGGSELDDHVVFSQTGASDIALQTLMDSGTATNTTQNISGVTGRVVAYGNPGNDTLDASGLSTKQATLDGGAGNNTLRGGNGGDILIGGTDGAEGSPNGHRDGNNVIIAGSGVNTIYGNGITGKKEQTGGNNLIIGGSGADTIYGNYGVNNQPMADGGEGGFNLLIGGAGADTIYTTQSADGGEGSHGSIVIAGTTTYGTNAAGIAALQSILAEWSSGHALSAKRSYILGTGGSGGLNGANYLTPGGTVLNDAAIDSIFGDTNGSAHWFFYRLSQDLLSRSKAADLQTNVP